MTTGLPPFYSENINVMYKKIMQNQITFPSNYSEKAQSLVRGVNTPILFIFIFLFIFILVFILIFFIFFFFFFFFFFFLLVCLFVCLFVSLGLIDY